MASTLVTGLLGGIKGGSRAVEYLSKERLKQLAEELRMKTMEQIQERRDDRQNKYQTSEREAEMDAREQSDTRNIKSREGISAANNKVTLSVAKQRRDLTKETQKLTRESNAYKIKNMEINALTEAEAAANEGNWRVANALLRVAGLPKQYKEITSSETKPTYWGLSSKTKETTTMELTDTAPGGGAAKPATGEGGAAPKDNTVDALLAQAKMAGNPPQKKELEPGLLGGTPKASETTDDPESWTVISDGLNLYRLKAGKKVKLSDEEIAAWKKTPNGIAYYKKQSQRPKLQPGQKYLEVK